MSRLSISAISFLIAISSSHVLTGCATRKEKLLPHGDSTMLDIWNQKSSPQSPNARALLDAREVLRRPLIESDAKRATAAYEPYTRTAEKEIDSLFRRLPNPDLVMYVFPHLAGSHPTPVPGYSTVFALHDQVQYAMPGERTEDY
jgi:conjugative transfer region lipoprotein (TIGR03751 family)